MPTNGNDTSRREGFTYVTHIPIMQVLEHTAAPVMETGHSQPLRVFMRVDFVTLTSVVLEQSYMVPKRLCWGGTGAWIWLGCTTQLGLLFAGKIP